MSVLTEDAASRILNSSEPSLWTSGFENASGSEASRTEIKPSFAWIFMQIQHKLVHGFSGCRETCGQLLSDWMVSLIFQAEASRNLAVSLTSISPHRVSCCFHVVSTPRCTPAGNLASSHVVLSPTSSSREVCCQAMEFLLD